MHFGASVSGFAGCQRVVLDAPLSPVQSRPLTCAAGCQRVILDAPLSPVQSRPISRGRHVSLPARYHNIGCVKRHGAMADCSCSLQQSRRSFF